jgi:hypothetical protein
MTSSRMFNVLLTAAFVFVAAQTARQAVTTARIVSAATVSANPAPTTHAEACPFTVAELGRLRAAYAPQAGGWVTTNGAGTAAGVDGGLLAIRDCAPEPTGQALFIASVDRHGPQAVYVPQGGGWVARTSAGTATGVEGGLLVLAGKRP